MLQVKNETALKTEVIVHKYYKTSLLRLSFMYYL